MRAIIVSVHGTGGRSVLKALLLIGVFFSTVAGADIVGSVPTAFQLLGANDKMVIESFDDPMVAGVTCYISRATRGGLSEAVGLAQDLTDAAITCQQTAAIVLRDDIKNGKRDGEEVFKKNTSLLFKTLRILRFYDPNRNTLVYLAYSNKLVDGAPVNSLSAVPVRPWG